jgi:hypothetical protein
MPTRRKRLSASPALALKAAELAVAVPQVVAHRLTRMALAGSTLSPRDRKEFQGMVAEKNAAFAASWTAMAWQTALAQQTLAASFLTTVLAAGRGRRPSPAAAVTAWHNAAVGVLGKGLAPVHRKAVANARRLARTKLR